jgi:mannose-1-phosphate guanylyltransferase
MAVHAVVLAGGPGERFWPASTASRPKPFLRLWGERSLLQETVERAAALVPAERVWVAGSARDRALLLAELAPAQRARLILEPARRDTAAAFALAALRVRLADPGALLVYLPADHFVGDLAAFRAAVAAATAGAAAGQLVTLGVRPRRPETGYGYIQCGEGEVAPGVLPVRRFIEKPDAATAVRLLGDGRYLWNCGVLVAAAETVLAAVRRHLPALADGLAAVARSGLAGWEAAVAEAFPRLPATSFDYGVLQHADNVAVVPADFPWDDVGSWDALPRIRADADGNHVHGLSVALDSSGSVLRNECGDRVLVGFGLRDLAVVVTDRAVVAAPRGRSADWKRMLRALREGAYGHLLAERTEAAAGERAALADLLGGVAELWAAAGKRAAPRPWGRETLWVRTPPYTLRLLEVRAGCERVARGAPGRRETQIFLRGSGRVRAGRRERAIAPGLRVTLAPGQSGAIRAADDVLLLAVSARA